EAARFQLANLHRLREKRIPAIHELRQELHFGTLQLLGGDALRDELRRDAPYGFFELASRVSLRSGSVQKKHAWAARDELVVRPGGGGDPPVSHQRLVQARRVVSAEHFR